MCRALQILLAIPQVLNRKISFSIKLDRVTSEPAFKKSLPGEIKLGKEASGRFSEDELPRPSADTLV